MLVPDTDWLGLKPRFIPGDLMNSIESGQPRGEEAHHWLFCRMGYASFGLTNSARSSFIPPGFKLSQGELIRDEADPIGIYDPPMKEDEILEFVRALVLEQVNLNDEEIVLPLSGGYDSRLLLWTLRDVPRDRIRTFSYGISNPQSKSLELAIAEDMARREGVRWEQISLGSFNQYWSDWEQIMGKTSHAHGMYHIEFYTKIRQIIGDRKTHLLSGLLGDVFSGKVSVAPIKVASDLFRLGYSHGLAFSEKELGPIPDNLSIYLDRYFQTYESALASNKNRIIELARTKAMLLRYLVEVPKHFGFEVITPLVDKRFVQSTLLLPAERRHRRLWQEEFFKKVGLKQRSQYWGYSRANSLDFQGLIISGKDIPRFESAVSNSVTSANTEDQIVPTKLEVSIFLSKFQSGLVTSALTLFNLSRSLRSYIHRQILFPLRKS